MSELRTINMTFFEEDFDKLVKKKQAAIKDKGESMTWEDYFKFLAGVK